MRLRRIRPEPAQRPYEPMNDPLFAKLEALLFIHGEPLSLKKIAGVLGAEKDVLRQTLISYRETLRDDSRGLALVSDSALENIFSEGRWGEHTLQLVTKPEFGKIMEDFVKGELEEDLTPAALEALSLMLYLGPISRSRVDYLRGVNSSFIVRSLLLRGLVERYPDPERPHVYLYRGTLDALKHLGVSSPQDLPEYSKFRELATMGQEIKQETPLPNEPG